MYYFRLILRSVSDRLSGKWLVYEKQRLSFSARRFGCCSLRPDLLSGIWQVYENWRLSKFNCPPGFKFFFLYSKLINISVPIKLMIISHGPAVIGMQYPPMSAKGRVTRRPIPYRNADLKNVIDNLRQSLGPMCQIPGLGRIPWLANRLAWVEHE